jgi:SAM-dependent methyltransferase
MERLETLPTNDDALPPENIYGHTKRVRWILEQVDPGATLIELGCGTGYMISRPLTRLGYDMYGVDLDRRSVEYGQRVLRDEGLDPERLQPIDLEDLDVQADAVIASEILEHVPDEHLEALFDSIRSRLRSGGQVLVTVPNGRGWFELESFLWFKTGIGGMLVRLGIVQFVVRAKRKLLHAETDYPHPSTLADSPHVRFFTLASIQRLLREQGFEVTTATGSVMFAGPFSNLAFTGIGPVMKLNAMLGRWLPRIAAGFYVAGRSANPSTD